MIYVHIAIWQQKHAHREVAGFFHSLRLSYLMNASSVDSVGSKRQEAEGGGVPREEAPPATLTYRVPEISFSVTFFGVWFLRAALH
jgi:hypothetical protein